MDLKKNFGANIKVELNSNSGHPSPCSCLLLSQSFVVIISAPCLHIRVWWRDGVRGRLITCFGCRVSGSQCRVGRRYAVYNQLILDIRVLLNNKSRHYSSSSYFIWSFKSCNDDEMWNGHVNGRQIMYAITFHLVNFKRWPSIHCSDL